MTRLLTVTALYTRDADDVFAEALGIDAMIHASRGMASYYGMCGGNFEAGETYVADVTVWGVIRTRGHRIVVDRIDRAARVMETREAGGAIRRWDHKLTVQPAERGCTWTDSIVIDASWTTAVTVRIAERLYRARHRSRKALSIASEIIRP